jgi:hypothetical protein
MIYVYLVLSETAFVWPFKSFEVRNSFSPKLLVHKIDTTMFQMNKGARLHRTGHPIQIRVRWNRSGPVHETVRFTVPNRAYIFFIPTEPAGFTGLPAGFFLVRGNRCGAVWGTLQPARCIAHRYIHITKFQ